MKAQKNSRKSARARNRAMAVAITVTFSAILSGKTGFCGTELPTGEQVVSGQASISRSASAMQVSQSSDRAIINWNTFNIGSEARVKFVQPSVNSVVLNRVLSADPSRIDGALSANGKVFLVNPSGIVFCKSSSVNVGGLVASSMAISDSDFNNGTWRFTDSGSTASVLNQGRITASEGGLVALLGASVQNEGVIEARLGSVLLASGEAATLTFGGDNLYSVAVDPSTVATLIDNKGIIQADGGSVVMRASTAGALVSSVINTTGTVRARSIAQKNGTITLSGDMESGVVTVTGNIDAGGTTARDNGGSISISGGFIGLGGEIEADGARGGSIDISASSTLSLAETVHAKGLRGSGGSVTYRAGERIFETGSSSTDVSGTFGGSISAISEGSFASSGSYRAEGRAGKGGSIDITARDLRLLTATLDASGTPQGGLVRIGGAAQGGKSPDTASPYYKGFTGRWGSLSGLTNASQTFVNDGTVIDVSSKYGSGGTAVIWSDRETTFLGSIDARGRRTGGFVEISSAETLRRASLSKVNTGRGGTLLLDPKDIVIGEPATVQSWNYAGILGALSSQSVSGKNISLSLGGAATNDSFGGSVALNGAGNLLAVGAILDDGFGNAKQNAGAVYLFSFTGTSFSGWILEGIIGSGYNGGKNLNVSLDTEDRFGSSVALNSTGDRLAVGSILDDGSGSTPRTDSGAVYLFSFIDSSFTGGHLEGIIGYGYSGSKDINVVSLGNSDMFGTVSLNSKGDRLAVGAQKDDGYNNMLADSGAVYLFSFTDTPLSGAFSGGVLRSTIGSGYTGGNNVDIALDAGDLFGESVALTGAGDHIAIGSFYDDGFGNTITDCGAVYLFSFTDTPISGAFSGGTLQALIGSGYTGDKNYALPLVVNNAFGGRCSFNAAGDRLAVGARGAASFGGGSSGPGAVYLFSFSDGSFSGANLEAMIGNGYSGGKNINLPLDTGDGFGYSVSLNGVGDRMAVGANQDDGFGNTLSDIGAVYLFSFTGSNFSGGVLQGIIGADYTGGNNLAVANLNAGQAATSDNLGTAVALNGTGNRLAIGAPGDDGSGNTFTDSGAVFLFSFTNNSFSGGVLEGIIGYGYSGGKNISMTGTLAAADRFGSSVALNSAGDRLAVGATGDDGSGNALTDSGAVYLFSFQGTSFSDGTRIGTIGYNYSTGKNVNLNALAATDSFGSSVALSQDGKLLAVGASGDDGATNTVTDSGAVYLFSFSDTSFSDGTRIGTIGSGYTGTNDLNLSSLDISDKFGSSVALNGTGRLMAIGATGDDAFSNTLTDSGALYLFRFSGNFTGAAKVGTVGYHYTATEDINLSTLETNDNFGASAALNSDGKLLVAGATGDDGFSNVLTDSGALHLFTFGGSNFTAGSYSATLGYGYTDGKSLNVQLGGPDSFGSAVALNSAGDRLAVGADTADAAGKTLRYPGAVYLFSFTDTSFSSVTLEGIIGNGFSSQLSTGFNISLNSNDWFGNSVAMNEAGDRMAISLYNADGFGNTITNAGAVYLFSFTDSNFSGTRLEGIIGAGYTGGKNINVALDADDNFSNASLNDTGDRLVVSAVNDDGFGNTLTNSGAVYLFSFTDTSFSGGLLEGIIGNGYTGGKNINVTLGAYDLFGNMTLSRTGDRLAAGAQLDDGFNNSLTDAGAVYLFSFSDRNFSGGKLEGVIGSGYTGGKNINMALDPSDLFGQSVALNSTGDKLAIGSYSDDGFNNALLNSGALYLFSFTDTPLSGAFSGGMLQSTIGSGYTGAKNVNLTLTVSGSFGDRASFNTAGDRLVVGARNASNFSNTVPNTGAVYLFTFSDSNFSNGTLIGTIGSGYTGGKNINLPLDSSDGFGIAVSLNGAGDRLVVGSFRDDGFGNTLVDSGAVYLFSFTDTSFSGGALQGIIGSGYAGSRNVSVTSSAFDSFGSSVSLNGAGNLMAVGANLNDGLGSTRVDSGVVYLFSFTNTSFSGGTLQGIIGSGYSGGRNLNVALDMADGFGSAVALNSAGSRLAVGATGDDGFGNSLTDSGAIYLFSFSGTGFSGGALQGTLGYGYTAAGDMNISSLDASDKFGASVALNSTARLMAVGATGDDGFGNALTDSGALYLFRFSGDFTGGAKAETIGYRYSAPGDFSLSTLDASDNFGTSVALTADGRLMAVGATGDDGFGNSLTDSGAIYLFSFTDTSFGDGIHAGTIGYGYTGGRNVNVTRLAASERFGTSVALNGTGNQLAAGADGDDGAADNVTDAGALSLFSFMDSIFSGGALQSMAGYGYTGGWNIDLSQIFGLRSQDAFGASVALNADGTLMAVGANLSNGIGNNLTDSGAVYLFTQAPSIVQPWNRVAEGGSYGSLGTLVINLRASDIVAQLAAGTSLVLQASDDITLSTPLSVTGSMGGNLTLQAGRSIILNRSITTANGNLTLIANDRLSSGVLDGYRDAGDAVISMAEGTTINAGTGAVLIDLRDGAGKTNRESGEITLGTITAGSITAVNSGPTAGSGITLNGTLSASGSSTAMELAGMQFTNNGGSSALSAPNGRWLVWSGDPTSDTRGGIVYTFKQYDAAYGTSTVLGTGNGFLYQLAPVVTPLLTGTVNRTYDASATAHLLPGNYEVNGAIDGDIVVLNNPAIGSYSNKNVGTGKRVTSNSIQLVAVSNGEAAVDGYRLASTTASADIGTITPLSLPVTGLSAKNKFYDTTTAATLTGTPSIAPLSGDDVTLGGIPVGRFADSYPGFGKQVTVTGNTIGGADAGNYILIQQSGLSADISPLLDAGSILNTETPKVWDSLPFIEELNIEYLPFPVSGAEMTRNGPSARWLVKH